MATEDELPEQLDKLQITPVLPLAKFLDSNLPVHLNPFYENDLKNDVFERIVGTTNFTNQIKLSQSLSNSRTSTQNCRRCRNRRPSDSALDELKHISANAASDSIGCVRTLTNGVIKHPLKKSASSLAGSGNRKIVLREPVLKALQTCLHPQKNLQTKLLTSAITPKATHNSHGPLTIKGISDFRDLIDECRNLLSKDVDFSSRLNQLCLSNRNTKNFTTMRIPKGQSNQIPKKNRCVDDTAATMSLPSPESAALNVDQQTLLSSNSAVANSEQSNASNLSPDQILNPVRCNTTCSQQAGSSIATATCDDVTIDELASYFDTLVHIPKKMSSMAEMMYI